MSYAARRRRLAASPGCCAATTASSTAWKRPPGGPGEERLIDGGGASSAASAPNVRRGADFVFAGVGRDTILVYHDGSPDLVKCGARVDRVQYTGRLEKHDIFHGCEHVDPYSP